MGRDEHLPDESEALDASEMTSDDPHGGTEMLGGLRAPVWLGQTLRRVRVPSNEISGARGRVEERVFASIPHGTSKLASKRRRRRVGFALALTVLSAVVWVSALASSALPSSPLYGVKRGEEWLAYQTAWSDGRRSDVLLLSASRRLEEAQQIAGVEESAAVGLALELRGNLLELISIYQTMNIMRAADRDARTLAVGLMQVIGDQTTAAEAAEAAGMLVLANTFRENLRLAKQALSSRHLATP